MYPFVSPPPEVPTGWSVAADGVPGGGEQLGAEEPDARVAVEAQALAFELQLVEDRAFGGLGCGELGTGVGEGWLEWVSCEKASGE